jgi:hypothetical protein
MHLVLGIFSVSISKKKGLFCFLLPAVQCNVFRKKINCEERKKTLLYSVFVGAACWLCLGDEQINFNEKCHPEV